MKKTILSIALSAAFLLGVQNTTAQEKNIDTATSNIHWLGKKVTGQHEGDISLKSGSITMTDGAVTGGNFVVDMGSMTCTDLEGEYAGKLIGHLKSDDFFGVENHPEATLVFTSVTPKGNGVYAVTGDFTIKGITKPANFDLTVAANSATAKVIIDRSKHDIRYGSNSFFDNLGDKAIYNDFELDVTLKM
jgi:polyisoprenoid-binding protein YceI